jgi:nucleoside-diphosphate-sugar epimerase
MRIFLTGGSGFVGRAFIAWAKQAGHAVVALARSEKSAELVRGLGAEAALGDLDDVPAMAAGMRGCDAVVHAAAATQEWGTYAQFFAANVTGTERVLQAAREASVRRVIHLSTEAVLLDGKPLVRVDETRPIPKRVIGNYPKTKALAEQRALAATDLEVVVVRPRFIWGKGDTSLLPKLVAAARAGKFAWIGGGRFLTSTCHVENVCEGVLLAATLGKAGQVYFLTDGPPVELRSFMTELLRTQGVDVGAREVPRLVAGAVARMAEAAWRVLPLKGAPPLQRTAVLLIGQEVTVVDAKARRELGYTSHRSRADGLAGLQR